jgi:hypothetical protein
MIPFRTAAALGTLDRGAADCVAVNRYELSIGTTETRIHHEMGNP